MISPLIEKIRPIGINTDISPKSIEAGNEGNRSVVNPVIDCLNRHYYTSENGDSLLSENIRGNVLKANSLPSGSNVCIGTYEDQFNNQLVFWNYNSNGNHGVYAYSPETDLISTLLRVSGLNFKNDRRYFITGIGSVGQLLYWTDGINPQRVINMSRSYAYGTFSLTHITVIKVHPITRVLVGESNLYDFPEIDRTYDSAIKTNRITDKNIQFSYRFKYLDDEYSVIAPYSTLSFADYDPDFFKATYADGFRTYSYNNKVRVRVTVPTTPNAFIKNVELMFREGNSGNWKTWKTVQGVSGNIDTYYTGAEALTDIDQTETAKLFESVSNFSKGLAIHKNRLFITADEEGFDVNDTPTLTITEKVISQNDGSSTSPITLSIVASSKQGDFVAATGTFVLYERVRVYSNIAPTSFFEGIVIRIIGSAIRVQVDTISGTASFNAWTVQKIVAKLTSPMQPSDFHKTYFKTNGIYIACINVFDAEQRCMGIISKTQYNVGDSRVATTVLGGDRYIVRLTDPFIKIDIAGNFASSPKVKYYSIGLSKEQAYQQYVQVLARPLFYLYDKTPTVPLTSGQLVIDGRVFLSGKPTSASNFNRIYLQLPKEMPFVVDKTYFVRYFDPSTSVSYVTQVLDVVSDYVVVSDFGATYPDFADAHLFIEIFQPKITADGFFYEVSDRYSVDNSGLLSQTTIDPVYGDTYRPIIAKDYPFSGVEINHINSTTVNFRQLKSTAGSLQRPSYISNSASFNFYNQEIPTPTTKTSVEAVTVDPPIDVSTQGLDSSVTSITYQDIALGSSQRIRIPDYQKIDYNQGKPIVEVPDKKAFQRTSTIRFSNKYVQDTKINGLSSFDTGNQYPVSFERGPITKLQEMGNRILCIHAWSATMLFTEEKMLRNADGTSNVIAAPETAIGYDRPLQDGGYGSFHPESVVAIEGQVFGFDIYAGVVWRYTVEGQFPVSDYGLKQFFKDKSERYIAQKDTIKIIGGHDPFHKEYLITFNDGTNQSQTLAFNYVKKVWTTRYSFIPDYYGKINNKLISFKDGQLWVHNQINTFNNFYGVQYNSLLKIAVNPKPTKVKVPLGIDLAIEAVSSNVDFKQVEIYTRDGQYTYLKADEWDKKERVFYADILRDTNTPTNLLRGNQIALRDGDEIRSDYFLVQINDDKSTRNHIQMFNMAYEVSDYSQ